jgi:tetratricopeptide (TPR) repeat protein
MNERLSGTVFGGSAGGLIGGLAAESVGGALVGGLGGALVGYLVGDYLADQRERGSAAQQRIPYAPDAAPPPAVGGVRVRSPVTAPASRRVRSPADEAYERGRAATTAPEARAAYREALGYDPNHADAWNALGLSLLGAGRTDEAKACFRRAIDIHPSHYAARQNLRWAESGIR